MPVYEDKPVTISHTTVIKVSWFTPDNISLVGERRNRVLLVARDSNAFNKLCCKNG